MFNNPLNRWWTVAGGALGCAVGLGVVGNAFGIFTQAIAADFHWDRATVTLGLTILHIGSGIGEISLGAIMLRWGVRRPAMLFVTICAATMIGIGLIPRSPWLFYTLFAVMGFTGAAATPLPYAVAICAWFDRMRGLALGIMVTGTGLGASLIPLYANSLRTVGGWRIGFIGLGLLIGTVSLIELAFMVRLPPAPQSGPTRDAESVPSFLQIFTNYPAFWLIGIPIFGISIVVSGMLSNIVPIMTERGFSTGQAVGMLSIAGFASWGSRMVVGYLLDHIFGPFVAAAAMLVSACGLLVLNLAPPGLPAAYVAAVCIGISLGSEGDLVAFLISRYFRPEIFSKVVGAAWVLWAWGNGLGITVASLAFDITKSYQSALWIFMGVAVASAAVVAMNGAYPEQPVERPKQKPQAEMAAEPF